MRKLFAAAPLMLLMACPPFTGTADDLVGVDSHGDPLPRQQRIAVVITDVGDDGFSAEAAAMVTALEAKGFSVRTNRGSTASPSDIFALVENEVRSGDQVLIDIQVHGGEPTSSFTTASGSSETMVFAMGAKHYLFNPGRYQLSMAEARDHYMPSLGTIDGTGSNVTAGELADVAQRLTARGVMTAVVDHSCFGGGTVLAVGAAAPNACAIATAGSSSVASVGFPAVSGQISRLRSVEDIATYVTDVYELDPVFHAVGNRLHQMGYATGCSNTMAVRETMALTNGSIDTWWHWNRFDVAHVVRAPGRYLSYGDAVWPLSREEHPDGATGRGWQVWYREAAAAYAPTLSGAARATFERQTQTLLAIAQRGNIAVEDLRKAVNLTSVSTVLSGRATTVPLDEYLRDGLVGGCICMLDSTMDPALLAYQVGARCNAGRGDAYRNAPITSSVPGLAPAPETCVDPQPFVNAAVAQFPTVRTALANLVAIESELHTAAIAVSRTLQDQEQACVSSRCLAQPL